MGYTLNIYNFILFVNYVSIKVKKLTFTFYSTPKDVKAMISNLS